MLIPWLELPGVAEQVDALSEAAGLDLARLGTTADAEEIKDTAVTQPLLVAAGIIAADQIEWPAQVVAAGHSIGEVTAAYLAGSLSAHDAVALAARRGAEMAAACAVTPTGMSAVLGGDADDVVAAIEAAGLTPANRNAAGQIVAAGELTALASFAANPPAGARVRALAVAGAFHTRYMAPAEAALRTYAATLDVADPRPILLSNADGSSVTTGAELMSRLVAQVTRPVRWDLCQLTLADLGVTGIVELAPGGTLTGLAKRELPGIPLVAIKTPADLSAARELIAGTREHGQGEHTPEFRVVVTPAKGVFTRTAGLTEGQPVARGARLGTVKTNRDEHAIVAAESGVLTEWLRDDGDIVAAGLPVVRLAEEN
jgi:[acyl-carrier-protein] S-malonyltransferase